MPGAHNSKEKAGALQVVKVLKYKLASFSQKTSEKLWTVQTTNKIAAQIAAQPGTESQMGSDKCPEDNCTSEKLSL